MLQASIPQPPPIHNSSPLLSLPYEVLLDIIKSVASTSTLCPLDLLNLSASCRHLYHLIHHEQRQKSIWQHAFSALFDTTAIYRRRLNSDFYWKANLKRRFRALRHCALGVQACTTTGKVAWLDTVDWQCLWDLITEHDEMNIVHIIEHQVHMAAIAAFRLGRFHDRATYSVCLPILSVLVNYDFTLTRFLTSEQPTQLVSPELSQFAYNFDADALISGPYNLSMSDSDSMLERTETPLQFCPAQDALTSALHLFFVTIFAQHPDPYDAIPGCTPIPLFQISSHMFDVEFLRRYERELFQASLDESRSGWEQRHQQPGPSPPAITNRYESTGFASKERYISDAYLVEGEWMGYYSFLDPDDSLASDRSNGRREDWFDGPMRLTLRRVPLDDEYPCTESDHATYMTTSEFPSQHLRSSPLTRFEGHGSDNLGAFTITGLVDDTECGQMTWEKTYIDSSETWEYSGRFILPMGLCGRWGDEEYGGPWWMWRVEDGTSQGDIIQPIVAGGVAGAAAAVAKAAAEAKLP